MFLIGYRRTGDSARNGASPRDAHFGVVTSAAPPVTGCGNSRSRQVVASAKVMHAAAASKTTSWRTPATSRYVLPAFSFIDN